MLDCRLTTAQLSKRWHVSIVTLKYWRWKGGGPDFVKIGRTVKYRIEDVETFEVQRLNSSTSSYINNPFMNIKPAVGHKEKLNDITPINR
jgi:hypothetical protein